MACIRPMTPVLFVGFGSGAWAVTRPPASRQVAATVVRTRMRLSFIRADRGYPDSAAKDYPQIGSPMTEYIVISAVPVQRLSEARHVEASNAEFRDCARDSWRDRAIAARIRCQGIRSGRRRTGAD